MSEGFLIELRSDANVYREEREQVPALLAATNRLDEARVGTIAPGPAQAIVPRPVPGVRAAGSPGLLR